MDQEVNKKNTVKDGIVKLTRSKWVVPVALLLIIAVQIGYLCYVFFAEKTSYHCDEVYSYGLANNFYGAYLESEDVYSHEEYNSNQWVSGDIFREYITVQPSERFRYDSVWYNQSKDRHPPLFYALIHTISSFMPDTFSFVPGFILNLIFFAVTQVFLFLLAKDILRSRYLALLLCLFWGFSMAALDSTIFVRMYCMLMMWTVILMYLHSRLFISGEKPPVRLFILLGVVTALGGLTQYLFYFVAFITAVIFCIHYLINKRFRIFLIYGSSMLLGVIAAFVIYPPSFRQLFTEGDKATATYFWEQLPLSFRYLTGDLFRITDIDLVWFYYAVPPLLLIAVIMSLPILFLFRKSEKLRGFFRSVKEAVVSVPRRIRELDPSAVWKRIKKADPIPLIIVVSTVMIVLTVSYSISFFTGFCSRYFYIIMPLLALLTMILAKAVFRGKHGKIIITVILLFITIRTVFFTPLTSVWTLKNDLDFRELTSGCNVSVIYNHDLGYDGMSVFSYELYNTEKVFYTTDSDVLNHEKEISELDNDRPIYAMVRHDGTGIDEKGQYIVNIVDITKHFYISDLLRPFESIDGVNGYEYVGEYGFIEGYFLIYRLR